MCCHSSNFDSCTSAAQCMLVSSTVCRMSVKVLTQQGLLNAERNVPERLHFATCAIPFKINVYTSVNRDFSYSPILSLQGSNEISTTPSGAQATLHHVLHVQHRTWTDLSAARYTDSAGDWPVMAGAHARVCALL